MILTRLSTPRLLALTLSLLLSLTLSVAAHARTDEALGEDGGTNTCTMDDYYDSLGKSENSGAYGGPDCNGKGCACNSIGCCGKYQFCPSTLASLGYTRSEFINSPAQQEEAIRRFTTNNYNYLVSQGAGQYIGKQINGVTVTWSGLLGAAHLGGAGGAMKMLTTNGAYDPDDGHTKLSDYMGKFAGFDTQGGAGGGNCNTPIIPPPGGFMTEQLCDPEIRSQLQEALKSHATFFDEAMRNTITPPASRDQIANSPCVSKELDKITKQFSSAAGGMVDINLTGSGPAASIMNKFFQSGFESLNEAASFLPKMLNFQSQASGVLGDLLGSLGGSDAFSSELCGLMVDTVLKFIQCQMPIELPSFEFSLDGGSMNDLLPQGCAGDAARDAIYGASKASEGLGLSQPFSFSNGKITPGTR